MYRADGIFRQRLHATISSTDSALVLHCTPAHTVYTLGVSLLSVIRQHQTG